MKILLVSFIGGVGFVAGHEILSTLRALEEHRSSVASSSVGRIGNVEMIPSFGSSVESIPVCHLINMNTYAKGPGIGPIALTATLLAAEHLHSGNGVVIPQIQGLNESCPIRFTTEFFDTKNDKRVAMEQLVEDIFQRKTDDGSSMPCAFMGNTFSDVSIATSVVTGLRGYAQVSVTSSAEQLNDRETHELFARVGPSSDQIAEPIVDFLYYELGVRNIVSISSEDAGQSALATNLKRIDKKYPDLNPITSLTIPKKASKLDIEAIVAMLRDTEVRYFVSFVVPSDLVLLLEEAYLQGIAGNTSTTYTWIPSYSFLIEVLGKAFESASSLA